MEDDNGLEVAIELANNFLLELNKGELSPLFERSENILKNKNNLRKEFVSDARELISKLQQDYSKVEEEGSGECGFSEACYKANKEAKEIKETGLKDELKKLGKDQEEYSLKLKLLFEKISALEEKKHQLEEKKDKFVPWKKDKFALFMSATGIHWNFGCKDNEIRGYVTGKGEIQPFSINSDEHDGFYTANYLWDVVSSTFNE
ncbi:kinetochore protein Spc24-like [Rhopilema esculentum]|uniref:kinetochore protein Spc24-like n=1 Tax=Rhopilema esculentum TaxID=499914 RepID=UPI0031D78B04|eukprot:gene8462-14450_t